MDIVYQFAKLAKRLGFNAQAQNSMPGFELNVEKQQAEVLPGAKGDGVYYVVSITNKGNNPEYPDNRATSTQIFTNTPFESFAEQLSGSRSYTNTPLVMFRLHEVHNKSPNTASGYYKQRPAHHHVSLDVMGDKGLNMSLGYGWIRKSDRDTLEWKQSELHSAVHYI